MQLKISCFSAQLPFPTFVDTWTFCDSQQGEIPVQIRPDCLYKMETICARVTRRGCQCKNSYKLDFGLTVHHQLGKVIQMKQLDATMIYWSIRSAQHVSGNLLPVIRSVRLRYLQHMVSCCYGGQGDGEWQHGTSYSTHSATLLLSVSMPTTTTGYHML